MLFRKKQHETFRAFIEDVLLNGGIRLLSLYSDEMETVISGSQKFNLDFDDSYQYAVAIKYDLTIISFDSDFQQTDMGHKTPSEILRAIS